MENIETSQPFNVEKKESQTPKREDTLNSKSKNKNIIPKSSTQSINEEERIKNEISLVSDEIFSLLPPESKKRLEKNSINMNETVKTRLIREINQLLKLKTVRDENYTEFAKIEFTSITIKNKEIIKPEAIIINPSIEEKYTKYIKLHEIIEYISIERTEDILKTDSSGNPVNMKAAHEIGLIAEKKAVEKEGLNWVDYSQKIMNSYSEYIDNKLKSLVLKRYDITESIVETIKNLTKNNITVDKIIDNPRLLKKIIIESPTHKEDLEKIEKWANEKNIDVLSKAYFAFKVVEIKREIGEQLKIRDNIGK